MHSLFVSPFCIYKDVLNTGCPHNIEGCPDNMGCPDNTGWPDNTGCPDNTGWPDNTGCSDNTGCPDKYRVS